MIWVDNNFDFENINVHETHVHMVRWVVTSDYDQVL